MSSEEQYQLFAKSYLFKDLKEKEKRALFAGSHEVALVPGTTLIREGDPADELFIVLEGSLKVIKFDPELREDYVIGMIHPGETLGDVPLLDHGPRAVSVRAVTHTRLRSIPFTYLHKLIEENKELVGLYLRLSENIGKKLRETNDVALQALRHKLIEERTRIRSGFFFILLVSYLCLMTYAIPGLTYLLRTVPNTSYVTLPVTLGNFFFLAAYMLLSKMPLEEFGITTKNLKRSVVEGVFYSLIAVVLICLAKWTLIQLGLHVPRRPFFDPYTVITDVQHHTIPYFLGLSALYVFLMVPLQEAVVRGGLQGHVEKFMSNKYKGLIAIITSNLIFGSGHVFFSVYLAIGVFFIGLYIGWLYSRTHNIVGCCLAHSIIGLTALSVLFDLLV